MCNVVKELSKEERKELFVGYKVAYIKDDKIRSICTDIEYKRGKVPKAKKVIHTIISFEEELLHSSSHLFSEEMHLYGLTACFAEESDAEGFHAHIVNSMADYHPYKNKVKIIKIVFDIDDSIFVGKYRYSIFKGGCDVILGSTIYDIEVL